MTQPNADELLMALRDLRASSDASGVTMTELATQWRVGLAAARQRVRRLIEAGLMECAGRKQVPRIDMQLTDVPSYRVKAKRK